jgi:hypothetical protein
MTRISTLQFIVMSAVSVLGIIGVVATNRLLIADMRHGLISWENDYVFLVTAYGVSILLALIGALGAAHLLGRRLL